MNRLFLSTALALCSVAQLHAQGKVNIEFDNSVLSFPAESVDLMQSDTLIQRLQLSYPVTNNAVFTSDTIALSAVDLNKEKPQSFNALKTFSLLKSDNSNLNDNIIVELGNQKSVLIVLPYLTSLSSLKPVFQTTGSYIYVNGNLWKAGNKVDFSTPAKVQVVAFNGDVRTYTIVVSKTLLPYFRITTSSKNISKDWSVGQLAINGNDEGTLSVKGKGSHYGEGLKNNFSLKFENKKSLLGITKNKRWLLVANEADKTLLRSQLGYWLGQQLQTDVWTPAAKPVNLEIDGQFVGCYTLVEQPRICKGRLDDGYLLSVGESADAYEDAFRTKRSKTLFVFEDPETGSKGTGLIRTQDKVDRFEKALDSQDWKTVEQMADLNSFATWLVVNEIAYNTGAFLSDTYVHVDGNGKIAMLPVWELKKAFACETDDYEGFVASATPWVVQLLKNDSFVSLVKAQYAKVKSMDAELKAYIDEQAMALRESAIGNNAVWKCLGGDWSGSAVIYDAETERLKNWLERRLKWLDAQW